jgi:imidazolonepropionase-like amidohydrolase
VTIIDATATPAKPDLAVVVIGNTITEIRPTTQVRLMKTDRVVEAAGKFLIPGLWDMHAHLEPRADSVGYPHFAFLVANGVTGVRAMMSPLKYLDSLPQIRQEIAEGRVVGPRIVSTGPILDGPAPGSGPGETVTVADASQARAAVRMVKEHGAAFVKIRDNLSRETFLAIADESKRQGLTFAGHTPISVTVAEASDAGMRSVEHLTGVLLASSSDEAAVRSQLLRAGRQVASNQLSDQTAHILATFSQAKAATLMERFRRNSTWQCPTLSWIHQAVAFNDKTAFSPALLGPLSPPLRAQWDTRLPYLTGYFGTDLEAARQNVQKALEVVGMMNRAGVPLLAGTDSPKAFFSSGYTLHEELRLMVEAGLSPKEALATATLNPARFFGTERTMGTIATGKLADLVLLNANPLDDIRNTTKIEAVVLNGRLMSRSELDALLANQATASK